MRRICVALVVIAMVGCSDSKRPFELAKSPAPERQQDQQRGPNAPAGGVKGPQAEKPATRKIIYTASVELIATDFDDVRGRIPKLAEQFEGFVGNSRMDAVVGDRRHATWTLRIPVANYRPALAAVEQLGHIVSTNSDSQDVTDEFYDLEARVKTKLDEEKTLREILSKSAIKLEDILTMRRELTRIREEIEVAQGRLNKLSKLSDMTTITVSVQEQKDYVPPTAPTLGTRVGDAFSGSASALWDALKALMVFIAALTPWLPLLLLIAGVGYYVLRRGRRTWSARHPIATLEPAENPPSSN